MDRHHGASPSQFLSAYCDPMELLTDEIPEDAVECGECLMVVPDVPRCAFCHGRIEGFSEEQVRDFDAAPMVPLAVCLLLYRLRVNAHQQPVVPDPEPWSQSSTDVPPSDSQLEEDSVHSDSSTTEMQTDLDTEVNTCDTSD